MATPSIILNFFYRQFFVTPPYPEESWSGKTVIVTGSNVGLGLEAARHFVRLGAKKLIMAVRDTKKGERAKESIIESEKCSPDNIEIWTLDLQNYDSVKAFAKRCDTLDRIDAFIENAGVSTEQFKLAEGHESTITTNVISTHLLALLILPKLKQVAQQHNITPHLAIVSSEVHTFIPFNERNEPHIFAALDDPAKASMGTRYMVSKLLEVLVCREWAQEYMPASKGYPVILNFLNPGFCHSELSRDAADGSLIKGWLLSAMKALVARTTEVGSRTLVHAASAGRESHGMYLSDSKVTPPAILVTGPEGKPLQEKVWGELREILEGIQPGVTSNF